MIDRILVGMDGSTNAGAALAWSIGLAQQLSATELLVIHAVGLLEGEHARVPADAGAGGEHVPAWWAELDGCPVPMRRFMIDGDPVSVLLRAATEHSADLIVVGSRGIGGRADLLLGSTSTQVAQRSSRPVVIVPSADGDPARELG